MVFENGSDLFFQISISRYAIIFPTTYSPDSSSAHFPNKPITWQFISLPGHIIFEKREMSLLEWDHSLLLVNRPVTRLNLWGAKLQTRKGKIFSYILNIIYF